jgi:predicted outer membrane protein
MSESSQSEMQFYQMLNQTNERFQQSMTERQQMFNQQMIALINQNTLTKQLDTTYAMTQAGSIVIEQPINLP